MKKSKGAKKPKVLFRNDISTRKVKRKKLPKNVKRDFESITTFASSKRGHKWAGFSE